MNKALILLLATAMLSACAQNEPKMVSGNAAGSSYIFDGSFEQLNRISQQAMYDCQKAGRFAVLKNTGQFEGAYIANFDCISCGGM